MILVGEAPGYQGCRFSGVPFTSERLILNGRIPRIAEPGRLTDRKLSFTEPSATVVWGMLDELGIGDRVVMWNAFAWHPHEPGEPYSNRAPSRTELTAALPILRGVMARFADVPVVPVGRKAEETLMDLGVEAMPWVRHPSRSGAALFREELRARFIS
jgi:uracil-DNA glycosylase